MTGEVCNKKKLICIFNIDLYGEWCIWEIY